MSAPIKKKPSNGNEEAKLLTTKEVAKKLQLSESAIVSWRTNQAENKPPFIKVGKLVRYNEEKLNEWLEAQSQQY
jgi:excisionase family DNA binding protein